MSCESQRGSLNTLQHGYREAIQAGLLNSMGSQSFVLEANLNSKHIQLTGQIRFLMNRIRSCDHPAKGWIR